jgi:hypothetical protein
MSYFVTITFDIKDAKSSPHGNDVYRRVTASLDKIEYTKCISGKKRKMTNLPSNTYVAKFDSRDVNASDVCLFIEAEVDKVFKTHSVTGRYFICVGKEWAWRLRKVEFAPNNSFKRTAAPIFE